MNDKLFVLISTIDERVSGLADILQPCNDTVVYIVSHQLTGPLSDLSEQAVMALEARADVRYRTLEGKGVAKNRNGALAMVETDAVCLILDDDIELCPHAFETVLRAFASNPTADFISFKILNAKSEDYKRYPKEQRWHSLASLTGVGTTEMAFRSGFILKHGVRFDERFGPGASLYPIGEDYIFAMDLYRLKARMLFCPEPIVRHPQTSTGSSMDEKVIVGRGAVFARVFGKLAFAADFYFAIKKRAFYAPYYSFTQYLTLLTRGSYRFLRNRA